MEVLEINTFDSGSTGQIAIGISEVATVEGLPSFVVCERWGKSKKHSCYYLGRTITNKLSAFLGYVGLHNNLINTINTHRLIRFIKNNKPKIIHLHNIHNDYLNLPKLFKYLQKSGLNVIWTLHDCWSFTGRCPYFTIAKCEKWQNGCYNCPYSKNSYPKSFFDNSRRMWKKKRSIFTSISKLTLVCPSEWLVALVSKSFFQHYQTIKINNGINLSIFKPLGSAFKEKNGISDKHVVLGVAYEWNNRKGIDIFQKLANVLPSSFVIVLVGRLNKKSINIPSNVLLVERTQNQSELAAIYSSADVFVNPTREDNFPTVNLEALACGTPVITFNTGGSPEAIDETCGLVVQCDDIAALKQSVVEICETKPFSKESCIARASFFNMNQKFEEYVNLYKQIILGDYRWD